MNQVGKQYSVEELVQLGEVWSKWNTGQKAEVPAHGPGGLLTTVGVRPDMYSAVPRVGTFAPMIPIFPSRNNNEIIEVLTGVTAQSGSNPDDTCGTPPVAGNLKSFQSIFQFGTFYKATQEINATTTGLYIDRADVDRRVRNPPSAAGNPFVPDVVAGNMTAVNTQLGKSYLEFAQGAMIDFALVDNNGDYTRAPAATQLGFIKEYNGLDLLVKSGWTDAITGQPVESADSTIVSYNAVMSSTIVNAVADAYRTVLMNGFIMGLPNVKYVIRLYPYMMFPLIDMWACNYQTARCLPADNAAGRFDLGTATMLRDSMLRGQYLLIDGEQVPIVTDAGMTATQNQSTGLWTSDIFIHAMEDGNGNALLYREYLPYTNPDTSLFQGQTFDEIRVMNNGMYMVGFLKREAFCFQHVFTSKTRLLIELGNLSARVDDVQYTSTAKFQNPIPGATYHRDGGTTFRSDRLAVVEY